VVDGALSVEERDSSSCRTVNCFIAGHGLNVEELHLAYVSKGVRVHRSSRAAMSPLGGSVSGDLANKGGGMKDSAKDQMVATGGGAAGDEAAVLPVLMTTTEVAELLRIDPSTLSKWRSCGQGPRATWLTPSTPRYARSDVLAWLGRAIG
jgi:predicted DNA-binding transcriptional regulator AlpA